MISLSRHSTLCRGWRRSLAIAACASALFLSVPHRTGAWSAEELYTPETAIPKDYESWSLFLICNPVWVLPQSEKKLLDLYEQFQAFGGVIGPSHVAVWFWLRKDISEPRTALDAVRSSAFCSRFDLSPTGGPYVVVTTDYPGKGKLSAYPETFNKPINFYVFELNGPEASEITKLLAGLADQVVAQEISGSDPSTEDFWNKWQYAFEATRDTLTGLFRGVRVSFQTSFFNVELKPE